MTFKGTFQRDLEIVRDELQRRQGNPEELKRYQSEMGRLNTPFEFKLEILEHILESGLIIGKCLDEVSGRMNIPSGVVGVVRRGEIKFEKMYPKPRTNLTKIKIGTIAVSYTHLTLPTN